MKYNTYYGIITVIKRRFEKKNKITNFQKGHTNKKNNGKTQTEK